MIKVAILARVEANRSNTFSEHGCQILAFAGVLHQQATMIALVLFVY